MSCKDSVKGDSFKDSFEGQGLVCCTEGLGLGSDSAGD